MFSIQGLQICWLGTSSHSSCTGYAWRYHIKELKAGRRVTSTRTQMCTNEVQGRLMGWKGIELIPKFYAGTQQDSASSDSPDMSKQSRGASRN